MSPEIHVGKHKQPTVAVILLTGHLGRLARHGFRFKLVLLLRVLLSPASRNRGGVILLQLALPLVIQVSA